jgi:hypothetical protein
LIVGGRRAEGLELAQQAFAGHEEGLGTEHTGGSTRRTQGTRSPRSSLRSKVDRLTMQAPIRHGAGRNRQAACRRAGDE